MKIELQWDSSNHRFDVLANGKLTNTRFTPELLCDVVNTRGVIGFSELSKVIEFEVNEFVRKH